MTKVRVAGFSVSIDGFGAGPEQSLSDPLGEAGLGAAPMVLRDQDVPGDDGRRRWIGWRR